MLGSNCGTPKKGRRDPDRQGQIGVDPDGDQGAEGSWILTTTFIQGANSAPGISTKGAWGFGGT